MVAFGSPASAASLRFWLGDGNYPGVFNGAGTVYNDLKSNPKDCAQADASCNASHQIPGTGGSEPDFSATSATFITGVFTMVATADGANKVWDDKQPHYAGLGVGSGSDTGAGDTIDQINGTNILKMTFTSGPITLTGVATLFDLGPDNHGPFGSNVPTNNSSTAKFKFSIDDGATWQEVLFTDANLKNLGAYLVTGTDFWFMQDGESNPQFYVSALEFTAATTPVPAALPLFATGLGAMGLLGWRKKRKAQAAA
jgi:hypothetical protein